MRRVAVSMLAIAVLASLGVADAAHAAPKPRTYKTCKALNKAFAAGVALDGTFADSAVRRGFIRPAVAPSVYMKNTSLARYDSSQPAGVVCPVANAVPPAPAQVRITGTELTDSVLLMWTPDDSHYLAWAAVVYDVYRDGVRVAEGLTTTTYWDRGLTPGTTFTYELASRNQFGEARTSIQARTAAPYVPSPSTPATGGLTTPPPDSSSTTGGRRYSTCADARAAGVTPIRYGSSLYSLNEHLDRDKDGVACE